MKTKIEHNGVICDRCRVTMATKSNDLVEGFEYVCDNCLTSAERVAFGLESNHDRT